MFCTPCSLYYYLFLSLSFFFFLQISRYVRVYIKINVFLNRWTDEFINFILKQRYSNPLSKEYNTSHSYVDDCSISISEIIKLSQALQPSFSLILQHLQSDFCNNCTNPSCGLIL